MITDYQIKAIKAGLFIAMMFFYGWMMYQDGADKVTAKWNAEKAQLKAAYDKQLAEKDYIERIQNAINSKIQTDYNRDTRILSERLRDLPETTCTVSSQTDSASGINSAAEAPISFRASDALADTLQCSRLIEWVKEQGLVN